MDGTGTLWTGHVGTDGAESPPVMVFVNQRGDVFKLASSVVEHLRSHAQQDSADLEAGGILLGRYIVDTNDAVVDQITAPFPSDERSRFAFVRLEAGHQDIVNQASLESGGTCNYQGEWHTHPESDPVPTAIDVFNWVRLLAHFHADPDPLYFVIVGTASIVAWQGRKHPTELERLIEVADRGGGDGGRNND